VTVTVPELPGLIVSEEGDTFRQNAVTCTLTVTECELIPDDPFTVTV